MSLLIAGAVMALSCAGVAVLLTLLRHGHEGAKKVARLFF